MIKVPGTQTGIELNDQFSEVLNHIVRSVNLAVSAMYDMQESMNADIDTSSLEGARAEINQATMAVNELEQALSGLYAPAVSAPQVDTGNPSVINVDVNPVVPDPLVENPEPIRPQIQPRAPDKPVEVPFEWKSYDGLDVYISTGAERFQQELSSLNKLMNRVNATQYKLTQAANESAVISPEASYDVQELENRLYSLFGQIQKFQDTSLEVGTDEANNQLERLRSQMQHIQQLQGSLNQALDAGSVEDINDAYLRLTQSINNAQRYVRDTTAAQEHLNDTIDEEKNGQEEFNQKIQEGTYRNGDLMNAIKGVVADYVNIQSIGKALSISDEFVQTTARLNSMNDGVQTTQELVNMVYAAAQDSRGSFVDMAGVVERFGNNAGNAFSSSEEVVAFANLIQKQIMIDGASTQDAENTMLQLSQGLASGALRGEELNSILDQAPTIAWTIESAMGWTEGSIKSYAEQGLVTADVVKYAMLSSADEINEKFNEMPMTWGQIGVAMQNAALIAFDPVFQRLNDIANSDAFQAIVDDVIGAIAVLAHILLTVFDLLAPVGSFIADNWSIIGPIVYGIIAALEILAVASSVVTAAQRAWSAALGACPIVWIIVLIILLIAIIFAVCNAIAKMTGIADSGFGVITGGINVAIQFFKNLGFTVMNIVLGISNAMDALGTNMKTAFHNAICSIQSWFYKLLSTALSVIAGICEALNKLPFVEFDYSGITAAADAFAAKAEEVAGNKEDYVSISDAFNEGFNTFDTFQDGWAKEAFREGADRGDGLLDKIRNFSPSYSFDKEYTPDLDDMLGNSGIDDNLSNIAGDTGAIKDSMDITQEDLKYLRDIAEQEAVNRYTVAEIHVDMSGMQNTVNSGDNIDGFITKLTDSVNEAVDIMAEGEHK